MRSGLIRCLRKPPEFLLRLAEEARAGVETDRAEVGTDWAEAAREGDTRSCKYNGSRSTAGYCWTRGWG